MSYFGTQGPPQDSGFIGGIARGQARLRNAQANRARYSKGLGARKVIDFDAYRFIPGASDFPEDSILYKRAKNFTDSYPNVQETKIAVADGRLSKEAADPLLEQYERDKKLIAQWAEVDLMFTKQRHSPWELHHFYSDSLSMVATSI